MEVKNKYVYLLEYSQKETDDLIESVYDITESISWNKIENADKMQFFSVMKRIIQRGDFTSYSCVNLLRDIMTDEMYNFMLTELRKDIFKNEPLSIEIMKIITCDNFPEYYAFLNAVKDNISISLNFRKFINIILDFEKGKIKYFSFPNLNRKSHDSTDIEIDWSC